MAIDTAQKRAAALGEGIPRPELLVPSGGISSAVLRAQVAGDYLPAGGGPPPGPTLAQLLFSYVFRRIVRR